MLVKSPWNIVKAKMKEEGTYNRLYDPNLTGLITKVDPSVADNVVAEAFTVSFSNGQGTVTLSQAPVDINHVWVLSKDPTYVIVPSSLDGTTLTLVPYSHSHNHTWLQEINNAGQASSPSYYKGYVIDGEGNEIQDTSGAPLSVMITNSVSSNGGKTSVESGLSLFDGSASVDVVVYYVKQP